MSPIRAGLISAVVALLTMNSQAADSTAYIVSPAAGAVVKSPVTVVFGLRAPWGVAPAGTKLEKTGHHHLLVDAPLPDLSQPVPKYAQHLHFGPMSEVAPGWKLRVLLVQALFSNPEGNFKIGGIRVSLEMIDARDILGRKRHLEMLDENTFSIPQAKAGLYFIQIQ
jgi:hypothetical protein